MGSEMKMHIRECVIDITYRCRSKCKYCQWSVGRGYDIPLDKLKLAPKAVELAEIRRIVLSGGEPLLYPNLFELLEYYRNIRMVEDIVIITNGLELTPDLHKKLVNTGVTGFVFSLDSIDPRKYYVTRGLKYHAFKRIIKNLISVAQIPKRDYVIGINVVLSRANLDLNEVLRILSFAEENNIDFVKFQPVYDDGFLSKNAPELKLNAELAHIILSIYKHMCLHSYSVSTNLPEFWLALYKLLKGDVLDPNNCTVPETFLLLKEGYLMFCFWNQSIKVHISYADSVFENFDDLVEKFKLSMAHCRVWEPCFCIQPLYHRWL